MKITELSLETAQAEALKMPYAYLIQLSNLSLGITPASVCWDELLEGRFFDENAEIRIWREDATLCAAQFSREDGDDCTENTVSVFPKFGKKLTKREYLTYDSDGQVQVAAICLCGWEGSADHA